MGGERPKPPSRVVIVGAGPSGATLAWLLARRGIHVTLLERRSDFAREFRGEVLMPSGVEALEQMGLRALLEDAPSHVQQEAGLYLDGREIFRETLRPEIFSGRPPIAISQPAFLECGVAVRSLRWEAGRVTGVTIRDRYRGDSTERTIAADLVVGADGRNSMVRKELGLSAGPDISSRAAMIAQDFSRVSVPGAFSRGARGGTPRKKTAARGGTPRKKRDGSIAMPYGVATMCAHAGKSAPRAAPSAPLVARPHRARARPAQFVSGRIFEIWD